MAFTLLPDDTSAAPSGKFTLLPDTPDQGAVMAQMSRDMQSGQMFGRYSPDVVMGARQVADALSQFAPQLALSLSKAATGDDSKITQAARAGAQVAQAPVEQAWADYKAQNRPENVPGAGFARGLGQAAVLAPLTPAALPGVLGGVVGGAASGLESGLATPVYGAKEGQFWGEKGKETAAATGAGAGVGGAFSLGAKLLSPMGADALLLSKEGVSLTPGQAYGGVAKTIEDKLTSVPFLGDAIQSARLKGLQDFNRAMYARALKPFGQEGAEVAANAPVGREGVAAVGDYISSKYQSVLPQTQVSIDRPFVQSMGQLAQMTQQLPPQQQQQFVAILKQQMVDRGLAPGQVISGETMKMMDSELGKLAFAFKNGANTVDQRMLGDAILQAQANLRDMVARQNPAAAPVVRAADQAWAQLVQIERGAANLGAKDGVFSPAQLNNAVKRGDNSVRDRAFARGDMANQDLADAGKNVLPSSVPDSGTAGRAMVGAGGAALAGGGAHALGWLSPEALAIGGTMALPYLPGIGPAVTALLTKRPELLRSLASIVGASAPAAGLAAGSSLLPNQ